MPYELRIYSVTTQNYADSNKKVNIRFCFGQGPLV